MNDWLEVQTVGLLLPVALDPVIPNAEAELRCGSCSSELLVPIATANSVLRCGALNLWHSSQIGMLLTAS
jgi:hypothetical protein